MSCKVNAGWSGTDAATVEPLLVLSVCPHLYALTHLIVRNDAGCELVLNAVDELENER